MNAASSPEARDRRNQYLLNQEELQTMPTHSINVTIRLLRTILETYTQLDKLARLDPDEYDRAVHILDYLEEEVADHRPSHTAHYNLTAGRIQDSVERIRKALPALIQVGEIQKRRYIRLMKFVQEQIEFFKLLPVPAEEDQQQNVGFDYGTRVSYY